jgi:uncharacterized protein (DUF2252 family)
MLQSPFTFYRGAALNMAADLAATPATGLKVQACGDCHLLNFGAFATPERNLVFDINDFDETLTAPWEWDLKRLATSFVLAGRNNGFRKDTARDTALSCIRAYRERMADFSQLRHLDVWYARITLDELIKQIKDHATRKRVQRQMNKERVQSVQEHDHPLLARTVDRMTTIKDRPPTIYHLEAEGQSIFNTQIHEAFTRYRSSLQDDRRLLLDRFDVKDVAVKVVGVGSVGTWCGVVLLLAREDDPLFLQVKEARASVLEAYAGKSPYASHGERIVTGCRLMQAASDLFLGWTKIKSGPHYYVRQLKDMRIQPEVEHYPAGVMHQYAQVCGWALARAHARSSGDPARISGYLGKSDLFDEAVADFALAYADQTEQDYEVLARAAHAGKIPVADGID